MVSNTRQCSVENCDREVRSTKDLCRLHYERLHDGIALDKPLPTRYDSDICKYEGCQEKRRAYGYCSTHGRRLVRYGDPSICKIFRWKEGAKKYLLYNAKVRSKKFNLDFNITPEDVEIPEVCPVLQIPIVCGKKLTDNSPTVDRIQPNLGYVKGNVHVISHLANRIKNNATPEQLMKVALYFKENKCSQ